MCASCHWFRRQTYRAHSAALNCNTRHYFNNCTLFMHATTRGQYRICGKKNLQPEAAAALDTLCMPPPQWCAVASTDRESSRPPRRPPAAAPASCPSSFAWSQSAGGTRRVRKRQRRRRSSLRQRRMTTTMTNPATASVAAAAAAPRIAARRPRPAWRRRQSRRARAGAR